MLTREDVEADTDSSINLTVNTGGVERVQHTFPDSPQTDQEKSVANLYDIDTATTGLVNQELTGSSVRVGINGSDAWRPHHIFVFGEGVDARRQAATIALALETNIGTPLSTDSSEGPSSMPLRLVGQGDANLRIRRLFILVRSQGSIGEPDDDGIIATGVPDETGTDGALQLQVVSQGRLVVLFQIDDTPQEDLEWAEANFYTMPVIVPFSRAELDAESITMRILAMDNYQPQSLFIFGADSATGRPSALVPLVSIPDWKAAGLGTLEPDPTNGTCAITLPLAPIPVTLPVRSTASLVAS